MNITLDQLKEIAKAGYGEDWFDPRLYMVAANNVVWLVNFQPNQSILKDVSRFENIVLTLSVDNDFVSISKTLPSEKFNHLAAIRKMEELGIILI